MINLEIYTALVNKALPLITAYHNDLLKHDYLEIDASKDTPFLHFTRDCGTTLVILHGPNSFPKAGEVVPYLFGQADRTHIAKGIREVADYCTRPLNETKLCLHFNGRTLREVTGDKAMEIARNHVCDLLNTFRKN